MIRTAVLAMFKKADKSSVRRSSPRHRSRWRKWLLRAAVVLVIVLILVIVIGQIIFSTGLPKDIVVNAFEKQMGVNMSVKSVQTGWFGNTTLNAVTLKLPLADSGFVDVPELRIEHTWLPWVLLGHPLLIQRIELDNPTLFLTQDSRGQWNLLDAMKLVTRTAAGGTADKTAQPNSADIPMLPELLAKNAKVVVRDNAGRSMTASNISITGNPDGALVYHYDVRVPGFLEITGKIAPGGWWSHEFDLHAKDLHSWFAPWVKNWPQTPIDARWTGQIDDGNLNGRLDVQNASIDGWKIAGPIGVSNSSGQTEFKPAGLRLSNPAQTEFTAQIYSGSLVLTNQNLESHQLVISLPAGMAGIDGRLNLDGSAASVNASWHDVTIPASTKQSGDVSIAYSSQLGESHLAAKLNSQGSITDGRWDASLNMTASGNSLKSLQVDLNAPKLQFDAISGQTIDLSGFAARIGATPEGLALSQFQFGRNNSISGQGAYSFKDHLAWLNFDGRNLHVPGYANGTVDLDVNVWANSSRLHVSQLYVRSGPASVDLSGDYAANTAKPVTAHLDIISNSPADSDPADAYPLGGWLNSSIDLAGAISPMNLQISGAATGTDVSLLHRPLGNLRFDIEGDINRKRVLIESSHAQVFGGEWNAKGHWPQQGEILRIDGLAVQHLSLSQLLNRKDVSGSFDGTCSIDLFKFAADGVSINGNGAIKDLAVFRQNAPADLAGSSTRPATQVSATQPTEIVAVDQIQFPDFQIKNGQVTIKPINLTRASGKATAELVTTLANPGQLDLKIDATAWPVLQNDDGLSLLAGAKGNLDIDLPQKSATGHLDVQANESWKSHSLGDVVSALDFDHRKVNITNMTARTMGGTMQGFGEFDMEHPVLSKATFEWNEIDLANLAMFSPAAKDLSGKMHGSLQIAPDTGPNPLAPLAVVLKIDPTDATFNGLSLGHMQVFAFLGPDRLVLGNSPQASSTIEIGNGKLNIWARISRHANEAYQTLVQLNLQNIDLGALIPPDGKKNRTPGLLSGDVTILTQPTRPELAFGQGSLTLERSDLANAEPISFIYNLLHFGHNPKKPIGRGTIDFTISGQDIELNAMRYFDRGLEVRLSGEIGQLFSYPNCPVDLIAVGSVRALASLNIPGWEDVDNVLASLQHDAVSVAIKGTLKKYTETIIPFSAIGQEMRNFLFQDSRAARSQNSTDESNGF